MTSILLIASMSTAMAPPTLETNLKPYIAWSGTNITNWQSEGLCVGGLVGGTRYKAYCK